MPAANRPTWSCSTCACRAWTGCRPCCQLRQCAGDVPIVVITAFGNLDVAVSAMRNGAFDYLTKPFDLEQAASVIDRALAHRQPAAAGHGRCSSTTACMSRLLGSSPAMQEVFKRIALVAPTDASVLITGESGTGKELVARAIHRHSRRAADPFVPIHLASLSPTLVESELFGHVRGAFTGAEIVARTGFWNWPTRRPCSSTKPATFRRACK